MLRWCRGPGISREYRQGDPGILDQLCIQALELKRKQSYDNHAFAHAHISHSQSHQNKPYVIKLMRNTGTLYAILLTKSTISSRVSNVPVWTSTHGTVIDNLAIGRRGAGVSYCAGIDAESILTGRVIWAVQVARASSGNGCIGYGGD